jgi:hypothetical protein
MPITCIYYLLIHNADHRLHKLLHWKFVGHDSLSDSGDLYLKLRH